MTGCCNILILFFGCSSWTHRPVVSHFGQYVCCWTDHLILESFIKNDFYILEQQFLKTNPMILANLDIYLFFSLWCFIFSLFSFLYISFDVQTFFIFYFSHSEHLTGNDIQHPVISSHRWKHFRKLWLPHMHYFTVSGLAFSNFSCLRGAIFSLTSLSPLSPFYLQVNVSHYRETGGGIVCRSSEFSLQKLVGLDLCPFTNTEQNRLVHMFYEW